MSEHEAYLAHSCACIHDGERIFSACTMHASWCKQQTSVREVSLFGENRGLKEQLDQALEKIREFEQKQFLNHD